MIGMADLFRVSLRQVIRQKGVGVILSIALGITAFISLSVLGREMRYKVGQDMVLMGGVNVIQLFMNDQQYPGEPQRWFHENTIAALRALPGVAMVSCNLHGTKAFTVRGTDEREFRIDFLGVDNYFNDVYAAEILAGRGISAADVATRARVCVLGRDAAVNLYGSPEKAVGQLLFLGQDVFECIGVIGGVMLGSWSLDGFLPYTTMMDRNWGNSHVARLFIRAIGWEDVAPLVKEIPATVEKCQAAPHLVVRTQEEQLERIKVTFTWVEALLWLGIAASLMLGGFGIWYGTFAAVRARTREVGLKKAMGGSDADILAQFLAEALCKSVAGGILGILAGVAVVEIGAWLLGTEISYPLLVASSLGSIAFSAVIGVAGGLYPAIQASRMDVVTALRFE